MKTTINVLILLIGIGLTQRVQAALQFPSTLQNELDDAPLNDSARKLIVLIPELLTWGVMKMSGFSSGGRPNGVVQPQVRTREEGLRLVEFFAERSDRSSSVS